MIGIYKITNIFNNKVYIGQSNNIMRRFSEHRYKGSVSRIPLDVAIQTYGVESFTFEVVEECLLEELNQKETFWIAHYQSIGEMYNLNSGGDNAQIGEGNANSTLTESDIIIIRLAYKNKKSQKEVYNQYFSEKISFSHFQGIWRGQSWSHIMPEVFTEELRKYYIYENSRGERGAGAALTNAEVLNIRTRYVTETAKQIYEDYSHRLKYNTLQAILWGRTYKDVPIYSKKRKTWSE